MFLPPEVMMSSFFLSTIFRKPALSNSPMSPVCIQPLASIVAMVSSGSL